MQINTTPALVAALHAAEQRFTAANPLSLARHHRARRVLPGGNARQTLHYNPFPVTMVRGEGGHLTDLDGHTYLNLVGDYAAGVFGHSCAPIQDAVRACLESGVSLSAVNNQEVELAELICSRIPSMQQVRFCNSGSEACVFAALLAQYATKRRKLLVFKGCYHGGFMIHGDVDPPLNVPFEVVKATYNDVAGTRATLRTHGASLAAVFVEPLIGGGGCIPGTLEFLTMLREETRAMGILLVFDEVMTSRLGPGGLQGRIGVIPDLTTLGKFWGGGFAFGAFGGAEPLMRHFDVAGGGTLIHGGTFNNNIMTMTAGLVGARDVYTADVCTALNSLGDWLRDELNELGRTTKVALQATGIGGVLSTHWGSQPIASPQDIEASGSPLRRLFQLEMLLRGFYVTQRGMITLALPVTQSHLHEFLVAVANYLHAYRKLLPAQ